MKLNIIYIFNHLYIAEGDKWLTAFYTQYGLFKYLVMLFSLINAPNLFQYFINNTLRLYLDVFCTAYINNILVYNNNLAEYQKHINLVLKALKGASLQLDIDKCEFHKTEVLYLRLIILIDSIQIDPKKIKAIVNQQELKNIKDIKAFIKFTNFY